MGVGCSPDGFVRESAGRPHRGELCRHLASTLVRWAARRWRLGRFPRGADELTAPAQDGGDLSRLGGETGEGRQIARLIATVRASARSASGPRRGRSPAPSSAPGCGDRAAAEASPCVLRYGADRRPRRGRPGRGEWRRRAGVSPPWCRCHREVAELLQAVGVGRFETLALPVQELAQQPQRLASGAELGAWCSDADPCPRRGKIVEGDQQGESASATDRASETRSPSRVRAAGYGSSSHETVAGRCAAGSDAPLPAVRGHGERSVDEGGHPGRGRVLHLRVAKSTASDVRNSPVGPTCVASRSCVIPRWSPALVQALSP